MTTPTDPSVTPVVPVTPAPAVVLPDPPATPVAPAAVVPDPTPVTFEHESTGNPAIDVALDFIGARGISPDDPALAAARSGDFTQIEAKLAALGDKAKGYDKHLALVKAEYQREQADAQRRTAEITSVVHKAAGGEERWKQVSSWASAEASPEQRTQINAALAAGGMAASAVVKELARQFDAKVGRRGTPAASPDAAAPAQNAAPMTASEYGKAVAQLSAKYPNKDVTLLPEYRRLREQRGAARSAGVR